MNVPSVPDTEELLHRAARADESAVEQLFSRHRDRLRRMIAVWMDARLSKRLDASDIVQESLVDAHLRLPEYLQERPLPFYAWLRQIAWNRLVDHHRRHIQAARRSVTREDARDIPLSDRSVERLARRLAPGRGDPRRHLIRKEQQQRVQAALEQLNPRDREILVMRHLEQLAVKEIAAILKVAEGTVKSRHFRALEHLRRLLGDEEPGGGA